ncbi:hypothetical protein DENSPDRAFT_843665 [Dentipellis sp. KUC8613]|nr:hypothetical protein DENSPDRAFT_843665 [Dentipellis sp. KUC8613]
MAKKKACLVSMDNTVILDSRLLRHFSADSRAHETSMSLAINALDLGHSYIYEGRPQRT